MAAEIMGGLASEAHAEASEAIQVASVIASEVLADAPEAITHAQEALVATTGSVVDMADTPEASEIAVATEVAAMEVMVETSEATVETVVEATVETVVEAATVEVMVEDATHQITTRTTTTHTTVKTTNYANKTNASDQMSREASDKFPIFKTATSQTNAMKLLSLLKHAALGKTMQNSEEMSAKISQRSESMQHKTSTT
jgi:hypothetical protein